MHEHRSRDAKKADAMPLTSHAATPSILLQPGELPPRTLGPAPLLPGFDLRVKRLMQLVVVVVVAMGEGEGEGEREMRLSYQREICHLSTFALLLTISPLFSNSCVNGEKGFDAVISSST